jgi:hypothetical protein
MGEEQQLQVPACSAQLAPGVTRGALGPASVHIRADRCRLTGQTWHEEGGYNTVNEPSARTP